MLHAVQAVAASRARLHDEGLTAGPSASSYNKASKWQTTSKRQAAGSQQS